MTKNSGFRFPFRMFPFLPSASRVDLLTMGDRLDQRVRDPSAMRSGNRKQGEYNTGDESRINRKMSSKLCHVSSVRSPTTNCRGVELLEALCSTQSRRILVLPDTAILRSSSRIFFQILRVLLRFHCLGTLVFLSLIVVSFISQTRERDCSKRDLHGNAGDFRG